VCVGFCGFLGGIDVKCVRSEKFVNCAPPHWCQTWLWRRMVFSPRSWQQQRAPGFANGIPGGLDAGRSIPRRGAACNHIRYRFMAFARQSTCGCLDWRLLRHCGGIRRNEQLLQSFRNPAHPDTAVAEPRAPFVVFRRKYLSCYWVCLDSIVSTRTQYRFCIMLKRIAHYY